MNYIIVHASFGVGLGPFTAAVVVTSMFVHTVHQTPGFSLNVALRGYRTTGATRNRDIEKSRADLERGLSEEFRTRRRENDVLRREREHQDYEVQSLLWCRRSGDAVRRTVPWCRPRCV